MPSALRALAVPGAITMLLLLVTRHKFPAPERFEPQEKMSAPFRMKRPFLLYIAGISLFAFGFIDYSIILMHISSSDIALGAGLAETTSLVNTGTLPLLYAGAMLVDAVAALVFGLLYDKRACGSCAGRRFSQRRLPSAFSVFTQRRCFCWGSPSGAWEWGLRSPF